LKNLRHLFDKYAVAGIEHDALVKSTKKIFFKFCGLLRKLFFDLFFAFDHNDFEIFFLQFPILCLFQ
jgi:hypothetical protein